MLLAGEGGIGLPSNHSWRQTRVLAERGDPVTQVPRSSSLYPLQVKYRLRFSYTQRNSLIAQLTSKQDYVDSWGTSFLYPPNPSQEPRALGHSDGGLPGEEAPTIRSRPHTRASRAVTAV